MWFEKLFTHDIRSVSPRIVDLEQPMLIVGMGIDTTVKNITRDVPALGKRFAKYKQSHEIPHKKIPWSFVAVSKDFDKEKGAFSYFIDDFENHDDRSVRKNNPEIDLYVAIRQKNH